MGKRRYSSLAASQCADIVKSYRLDNLEFWVNRTLF